jgi:hypothetical protein
LIGEPALALDSIAQKDLRGTYENWLAFIRSWKMAA